ncbi:unnamed protein product, partial [Durusdinium trenchii]
MAFVGPDAPSLCRVGRGVPCGAKMGALKFHEEYRIWTCKCENEGFTASGGVRASHHVAALLDGEWVFTSRLSAFMKGRPVLHHGQQEQVP